MKRTDDRSDVRLKFHTGIRLHYYLYNDQAIFLPRSDAFHEPATAHGLFICQV
jgi:hypothetical protein